MAEGRSGKRAAVACGAEVDAVELAALLATPPVPGERTLCYGSHPSQVVDLYGDEGRPTVALLHGGFWREAYDRAHLTPFAAALARRGVQVALVEYRRLGNGGGWPATAEDVSAALRVVGGGGPVVLAGHSAGGQLALWAAVSVPERVRVAVAIAPVADLRRADELALSGGAVREFLGGAPAGWPAADPVRLEPPAVPVLLVHGDADTEVPPALSARYAAHSGAPLRRLPGVGHYAPLTPGSGPGRRLLRALARLAHQPVSRRNR